MKRRPKFAVEAGRSITYGGKAIICITRSAQFSPAACDELARIIPELMGSEVWRPLVEAAAGHTGYTHQWRSARLRDVLEFCQASADSCDDMASPALVGRGTFRVLKRGELPMLGELLCPASKEAGYTKTCADCLACTGASGQNVAIYAHGTGAGNFNRRT